MISRTHAHAAHRYCFGIRTFRTKLKSREAFEALKPKRNVLVGRANMSFAPHFMPHYQAAFAYTGEDMVSLRHSGVDGEHAATEDDVDDAPDGQYSAPADAALGDHGPHEGDAGEGVGLDRRPSMTRRSVSDYI